MKFCFLDMALFIYHIDNLLRSDLAARFVRSLPVVTQRMVYARICFFLGAR